MIDQIGAKSTAAGYPRSRLPAMTVTQKEFIRGTADFMGINYYSSGSVSTREEDPTSGPSWSSDTNIQRSSYTAPEGIHDLLVWIKDHYDNPITMITENGLGNGGQLDDDDRVEYLQDHLASVARAINEDNCNVVAYMVWSLTDNFEWIFGFTRRFGIHYIDFNSQEKERVPKKSAQFFKDMMPTKSFEDNMHSLPEDFKIGAASASYQIEGAWNEDGKSPNIWDTITHKNPSYTEDGLNGDVSADSYHMYEKDVAALANIGVCAKLT